MKKLFNPLSKIPILEDSDVGAVLKATAQLFLGDDIGGLLCKYVSQFTRNGSSPDILSVVSDDLPSAVINEARNQLDIADLSIDGHTPSSKKLVEGHFVHLVYMNQVYDITIGVIIIISKNSIAEATLVNMASFAESIVRMNKKSRALTRIGELSNSLTQNEDSPFAVIGLHVDEMICPAETLIFVPRTTPFGSIFSLVYSSSGDFDIEIPINEGLVGYCAKMNRIVVVPDASDQKFYRGIGATLYNAQFFKSNGFESAAFVPVADALGANQAVILCCFRRRNAVSSVETETLSTAAIIISHYLSVFLEKQKVAASSRSAQKILSLAQDSLLIADVMHDAADDLRKAGDSLAIVAPRNDADRAALAVARDILSEIIDVSGQFKRLFLSSSDANDRFRGSRGPAFKVIEWAPLITEVLSKHQQELNKHRITANFSVGPDATFKGVRYSLKRALDNAVKNSIAQLRTATHKRRRIDISVRRDNNDETMLRVSIMDNGPGVPDADLNRIVEPFVSLRGGMGLGMSIILAAARSNGGDMKLSSRWGEFFMVTLALPAMLDHG